MGGRVHALGPWPDSALPTPAAGKALMGAGVSVSVSVRVRERECAVSRTAGQVALLTHVPALPLAPALAPRDP